MKIDIGRPYLYKRRPYRGTIEFCIVSNEKDVVKDGFTSTEETL